MTGHISNVKCLSICDIQNEEPVNRTDCKPIHRKLIFSAGGRAQLKIWRVKTTLGSTKSKTETSCRELGTRSDIIPLITKSDNLTNKTVRNCKHSENSTSGFTKEAFQNQSSHCASCDLDNQNDLHAHQLNPQDVDALDRENTSNIHDSKTANIECECSVECLAGLQLGQPGRRRKKPWQQPVFQSDSGDSEARIMDLSSWRATDLDLEMPSSLYFVSAACSDGEVR